jgi:exodeoxyribonuclease VII large subunit
MDFSNEVLYTPASINQAIESTIAKSGVVGPSSLIRVRGVVCDCSHKRHLYFSLRQEQKAGSGSGSGKHGAAPSLTCISYNVSVGNTRFLGTVANGSVIEVTGFIAVYAPRSGFQCKVLGVEAVADACDGTLLAKERALAAAEGLVRQQRRRLPELVERVAVLTSAQGDAFKDFATQCGRYPIHVTLVPVAVQGASCVADHVRVLAALAAHERRFDAVVLTRGGGGASDLEGYERLGLARAVHAFQTACDTPVVSAIGHTNDTPLLDDVADLQCATPTAAAKRLTDAYDRWRTTLPQHRALAQKLATDAGERLVRLRDRIERTFSSEALQAHERRQHAAFVETLEAHAQRQLRRWEEAAGRLRASPHHVLMGSNNIVHVTTPEGQPYLHKQGETPPAQLRLNFAEGPLSVWTAPGGSSSAAIDVPEHLEEDVRKFVARRQRQQHSTRKKR